MHDTLKRTAGTKVLAASVAMTEADMVDILDYLCNAAFAWLKEARWNKSHGSRHWTVSAFKRLHWKLKMPKGDSLCMTGFMYAHLHYCFCYYCTGHLLSGIHAFAGCMQSQ